MKILISGGTGLVGKELGKKLSLLGHNIVVLTRSPETSEMDCPYPHQSISWEELNSEKSITDVDHIIHLAGAGIADKRWTEEYKKVLWNSRVQTTESLVEFANTKCEKLQSFISTSGVGIYGDRKDEWLTEETPPGEGFLAELCKAWEAPIVKLKTARNVILRLGIVFSPQGGALSQMVPPIQMGFGGPLGNGNQYMSWIDIEDLVRLFIFCIDNNVEGTFNAVSPDPVTNKELTNKIAQRFSKKAFLSVPYFALRMAVGEVATSLLESQRVSCEKIQNQKFIFHFATADDSLAHTVPALKGTERRLIYEQWVPKPKEEIFPFFSEATNLEKITPAILSFQVLDSSTPKIEKNTLINYKLKINGVPAKWRTLIDEWNPPHSFVDHQLKGPYKKWNHLHEFIDLAGGTLMRDRIDLIIPFGVLGYGMTSWKVFSDVEKIFNHRKKVIHEMYFKNGERL